jgi:hypothetical protein
MRDSLQNNKDNISQAIDQGLEEFDSLSPKYSFLLRKNLYARRDSLLHELDASYNNQIGARDAFLKFLDITGVITNVMIAVAILLAVVSLFKKE